MELFCLGRGNYTERDIQEAARAFTGWEVRRNEFRFNRLENDTRQKTVLGQTGDWTGDDVLRILLAHPGTARFLARKRVRAGSETAQPPAALLEPLAEGLRQHDTTGSRTKHTGSAAVLLAACHSAARQGPVELAVGLVRALDASVNAFALADDLKSLGQAVFFPPNVKGWDGGTAWINSATLVGRANLAWRGQRRQPAQTRVPFPLAALIGIDQPAAQATRLIDLLLAGPLPDAVRVQLAAIASRPDENERSRLGLSRPSPRCQNFNCHSVSLVDL